MPRRRGVRFTLRGDEELMRKLRRLPRHIARTVLIDALKQATEPIEAAIRARAPVGPTGNLEASVGTRVRVHRSDFAALHVGPFAPHAPLVEFGHQQKRVKGGPVIGHVPPHPFARPAFDQVKDQAARAAVRHLQRGVEREAVRA